MSELAWWPEKGYGFQDGSFEYGQDYWDEFRAKDDTPMGRVLTALRLGMLDRWINWETDKILDVGIGGGAFVLAADCYGTDVNSCAVEWLRGQGVLWDGNKVQVMTFWDSLEHIRTPSELLDKATSYVFLSTPIYEDKEDCLASKHYKPGEHLWYFTDDGIQLYMRARGFECFDQNRLEDDAGREGIGTYAFKRV